MKKNQLSKYLKAVRVRILEYERNGTLDTERAVAARKALQKLEHATAVDDKHKVEKAINTLSRLFLKVNVQQ